MERSSDHQNPKQSPQKNPNPNNNTTNTTSNNIVITTNDRVKRDEWSEGAIYTLLEAYESKWTLRNRAKLKGQDWEDVARHVSSRAANSKSPKTQTQCKNKIESMKKRYRSESAAAAIDTPSWPLYSRLDHLLRGNGAATATAGGGGAVQVVATTPPAVVTDALVPATVAAPARSERQNSQGSNAKGDDNNGAAKLSDQGFNKNPTDDTESSTPQMNPNPKTPMKTTIKEERKSKLQGTMKRKREEYWSIGESIRWIAEAMVRSEEARLETMREIERMRVEAEEKRGEMDLRRTEIIANTQLEIARLFARGSSVDSSLGIGRN